jgi:hypothetical protein
MANITYNRIIRKMVVGFGNLFKDITLVRYNQNLSEEERLIVPIAYGPKELYAMRLEEDPDLNKKIQMTLPRLSFEMTDIRYDSSRKTNTNIKQFKQTDAGLISQYNPVPYDFEFSLYLYVRNIEDGTQVIEHILPFFTPDYTIKLNLIPEMGIIKEVPIILNAANQEITYEGGKDWEPRMIIWTLTFTVKGFIFGNITSPNNGGLVRTSITNILSSITDSDVFSFTLSNSGFGSYQTDEIVYQGYSLNTSTATGKVVNFANNVLYLKNINGNFVSTLPIIGAKTNASHIFTSYKPSPENLAQVIVTTSPTDANVFGPYTFTTQVNETPNIQSPVVTPPTTFGGDLMPQVGIDDLQFLPEKPTDLI